ncbi:hypothetical protein XAC9322_1040026 [Xanthomonas citri pv. citri]|nr:hypothetical protein XAC9322_1040026 [Xanthomonas citri pv. citri]
MQACSRPRACRTAFMGGGHSYTLRVYVHWTGQAVDVAAVGGTTGTARGQGWTAAKPLPDALPTGCTRYAHRQPVRVGWLSRSESTGRQL